MKIYKFFTALVVIIFVALFTFIGVNIYEEYKSIQELERISENMAPEETRFDTELNGLYTYYQDDLRFEFVQKQEDPRIIDMYVYDNSSEGTWVFMEDGEEKEFLHQVFVLDGYQFKEVVKDPKFFVTQFYKHHKIIRSSN